MKQLTIKILLLIIAAYLASAFIYADFNITHWSKAYRATITFIMGIIIMLIIFFHIEDNQK